MSKRVIRVTGKGQIKAKPDMARITMTIEDVKKDYDKALKAPAEDTETLKDIFERENFAREDVKTISFDVDVENESYRDKKGNWKSKFVGYKYCHVTKVEFASDNKRLGRILNVLANNTAVRPEFRFSFFVKDPEPSKNELLGKAISDAKVKAEILTKAAGVQLKDILSIDYSWGEINFEVSPMRHMITAPMALADEDECVMNIEPDDVEISDTVTVVWNIG